MTNHQKTKEQIAEEMKIQQEMRRATDNLEKIFLPALQKEAPKLLEAGKLTQSLQQMVTKAIQNKVSQFTISDLEIGALLDDLLKTESKNSPIYQSQKNVIEAVKGLSLNDFNQVMQWFGAAANKHAEIAAKDIPMEECFKVLSKDSKEIVSLLQPIIKPENGQKEK